MSCARPDLVKWVQSHCVRIDIDKPRNVTLQEMINWCEEHVGEERPHPIDEAYEGWIDYLEGDWAFDGFTFWFYQKSHMMQFMLKFL